MPDPTPRSAGTMNSYVTPRPRRATWANRPVASDDGHHIEIVKHDSNDAKLTTSNVYTFNNTAAPAAAQQQPAMPPAAMPPQHRLGVYESTTLNSPIGDDKLERAIRDLDNLQYELAEMNDRLAISNTKSSNYQNTMQRNQQQQRELGMESEADHVPDVMRINYSTTHNETEYHHNHYATTGAAASPQNDLFTAQELQSLNRSHQNMSVGHHSPMPALEADPLEDDFRNAQQSHAPGGLDTDIDDVGDAPMSPNTRQRLKTRRGVTIFRVERSGRFIELHQPEENPQQAWERKKAERLAAQAEQNTSLKRWLVETVPVTPLPHHSEDERPQNPIISSDLQTPLNAYNAPGSMLLTDVQALREINMSNQLNFAGNNNPQSLRVPARVGGGGMVDAQTSPHAYQRSVDDNSTSVMDAMNGSSTIIDPSMIEMDQYDDQNYYQPPMDDQQYMDDDLELDMEEAAKKDPFKYVPEDTLVAMNVDGMHLDKIRTFISAFAKGSSCPYIEFYRCVRNLKLAGNAVKKQVGKEHWWQPVHKTEVVRDTQFPQWAPFVIPAWTLCHNSYDRPILIRVWDHSRSGYESRPMGELITTLRTLLNANKDGLRLGLQGVDRKKKKEKAAADGSAEKKKLKDSGFLYFRTVGLCKQMAPNDAIKLLPKQPNLQTIAETSQMHVDMDNPLDETRWQHDLDFTNNPLNDYHHHHRMSTLTDLAGEISAYGQQPLQAVDYSQVTLVRMVCRAASTDRKHIVHANAPFLRVYRPNVHAQTTPRADQQMVTPKSGNDIDGQPIAVSSEHAATALKPILKHDEPEHWLEMHTTEVLKSDQNDRPWRAFLLNLHALHKSMCKGHEKQTQRFDSVNSTTNLDENDDPISTTYHKGKYANTAMKVRTGCVCYDTPLRFVCYSGHYHEGKYIGETKVTLRRLFTALTSAADLAEISAMRDAEGSVVGELGLAGEEEDQTLNLNTVNVMGNAVASKRGGKHAPQHFDLDLIHPNKRQTAMSRAGGAMSMMKYKSSGKLAISNVTVYMPSDISHLISVIATSPAEPEEAIFQPVGAPSLKVPAPKPASRVNSQDTDTTPRFTYHPANNHLVNAIGSANTSYDAEYSRNSNASTVSSQRYTNDVPSTKHSVVAGRPQNLYHSRHASGVDQFLTVKVNNDVESINQRQASAGTATTTSGRTSYGAGSSTYNYNGAVESHDGILQDTRSPGTPDSLDDMDPETWANPVSVKHEVEGLPNNAASRRQTLNRAAGSRGHSRQASAEIQSRRTSRLPMIPNSPIGSPLTGEENHTPTEMQRNSLPPAHPSASKRVETDDEAFADVLSTESGFANKLPAARRQSRVQYAGTLGRGSVITSNGGTASRRTSVIQPMTRQGSVQNMYGQQYPGYVPEPMVVEHDAYMPNLASGRSTAYSTMDRRGTFSINDGMRRMSMRDVNQHADTRGNRAMSTAAGVVLRGHGSYNDDLAYGNGTQTASSRRQTLNQPLNFEHNYSNDAMPLPASRAGRQSMSGRDKSRSATMDKAAMAEWASLMKKADKSKPKDSQTRDRRDTMNDLKSFFDPSAARDSLGTASQRRKTLKKEDINQIAHQYALKQLQGT